MSEPILKVTNVETYYGPIVAIRGVSFDVPQGGIVTILGANGAGKTTVLEDRSAASWTRRRAASCSRAARSGAWIPTR